MTATTSIPMHRHLIGRPAEHAFFALLVVLIAAAIFYGFADSYFLAGMVRAPLPNRLVHIHAAFFTSWIMLLLVQSALASLDRLRWHRTLGMAGFAIAVGMVILGVLTARFSLAAHRLPEGIPVLQFFYKMIAPVIYGFPPLVFLAFLYRRNPQTHKRLIVIATLTLIDAGIDRWPIHAISRNFIAVSAVVYSFLVMMATYDFFALRKVHKATLWGGAFLIVFRESQWPIGGPRLGGSLPVGTKPWDYSLLTRPFMRIGLAADYRLDANFIVN